MVREYFSFSKPKHLGNATTSVSNLFCGNGSLSVRCVENEKLSETFEISCLLISIILDRSHKLHTHDYCASHIKTILLVSPWYFTFSVHTYIITSEPQNFPSRAWNNNRYSASSMSHNFTGSCRSCDAFTLLSRGRYCLLVQNVPRESYNKIENDFLNPSSHENCFFFSVKLLLHSKKEDFKLAARSPTCLQTDIILNIENELLSRLKARTKNVFNHKSRTIVTNASSLILTSA